MKHFTGLRSVSSRHDFPIRRVGFDGVRKMSDQLVSVLIPVHNASRWLGATIESVLAQSWRSTEAIVVDDGSTDESLPGCPLLRVFVR